MRGGWGWRCCSFYRHWICNDYGCHRLHLLDISLKDVALLPSVNHCTDFDKTDEADLSSLLKNSQSPEQKGELKVYPLKPPGYSICAVCCLCQTAKKYDGYEGEHVTKASYREHSMLRYNLCSAIVITRGVAYE
jgi:hypothetical protein